MLNSAEHKFILLINVKMPTIVGILTFISLMNATSERLKARNFFIYRYFSFYEQLKFRAQLSWAWKKFYNLGALTPFEMVWTFSSGAVRTACDIEADGMHKLTWAYVCSPMQQVPNSQVLAQICILYYS